MLLFRLLLRIGLASSIAALLVQFGSAEPLETHWAWAFLQNPEESTLEPNWDNRAIFFCPKGYHYDPIAHICANETAILGPFPPKMIADCQANGGDEGCKKLTWEKRFAMDMRGGGFCPAGSQLNFEVGACSDGEHAYGPFTSELVRSCLKNQGGANCFSMRIHLSFFPLREDNYFCPAGFAYNEQSKLCESESRAMGPFTPHMIEQCKKMGWGEPCDYGTWQKNFAARLRGNGVCPPGATWNAEIEACTAGGQVYGPFLKEQFYTCAALSGGAACYVSRWDISLAGKVSVTPGQVPGEGGLNEFLVSNNFCSTTWEDKPGTADYTTYDSYNRTYLSQADRAQDKTLQGNKYYGSVDFCKRASLIRPCFAKAMRTPEFQVESFARWAKNHGIDPVRALLAKSQQETKLGTIKDHCWGTGCNGIGMGQILTAIDKDGKGLKKNDARWKGVTHNILTNIQYSIRVANAKSKMSSSLNELAYYYNGSSTARSYAQKVEGFYRQLQGCGL